MPRLDKGSTLQTEVRPEFNSNPSPLPTILHFVKPKEFAKLALTFKDLLEFSLIRLDKATEQIRNNRIRVKVK